jgi:hypothetical protein
MQEIDKGIGGLCGRMWRADYGPEAEILSATHCGGYVAPAHVKRKHTTLPKVSHFEHLRPQAVKAFPSAVGLLPFVPQEMVRKAEIFGENLLETSKSSR